MATKKKTRATPPTDDQFVTAELAEGVSVGVTLDGPALDPETLGGKLAVAVITPIGATKLRVLVDGAFGKPDDVIELDGEALAEALASGQVDAHPEAVAYAESLK